MERSSARHGPELAVPEREVQRAASAATDRELVLIADDSRSVRQQLVSILETLPGVEIRLACDGLEALALAREKKPDLMLSDHEMPGLNGIQLLRLLRGTWSRVELPILMLTSNSATETKVLAFQHGANDYVTKPVEPAELVARVLGQLELKRTIKQNLEARVQLLEARKYQAVGRLAAGVAHELNNPAQYTASNLTFLRKSCAAMQTVLHTTLEWAKAEEGAHPVARVIGEQSKKLRIEELIAETPLAAEEALDGIRRMASIIAEMKEFAGDPQAEAEDVDLNLAVRNTVEVSRSMWSGNVDVTVELEPELPLVRCAAHPVKQAFLNLLTNAVEALQSQPRESSPGRVTITSALVDDGVEICFRDNGPGIAPDVKAQLFEPFFSTKPIGQGMGQGLFVAYAIIVEQHRGKLECESLLGKGATFRVWLPSRR